MIKVLIVCSATSGKISPFITEQVNMLQRRYYISFEFYLINQKGIFGYLRNFLPLIQKINKFRPDIIHAHYGFSGLLANFQRTVPVITTFHGSDLNMKLNKPLSLITRFLSCSSIIVSSKMLKNLHKDTDFIIPCGVDLNIFFPMDKLECRVKLNYDLSKIYILFASHFDNPVKNFPLAKSALNLLDRENIEIVELKNKSRQEVNLILNAVDLFLMTSKSEGSPQIIKEAMACNCPIVSTEVGDVKDIIGDTEGCYICSFDPNDVAEKINKAIDFVKTKGRTNGRIKIKHFDNQIIADKVYNVYQKLIYKNKVHPAAHRSN